MKQNMNDDSRWSRGLQFVQSKIAVFEDLSDRTENQVKQLTKMMENKICDLQRKIDEADELLNKISSSMKKSIEVAQIFQDKIPHEEIIERQNTVKFVKAALLANEGRTTQEIGKIVDLPLSQIEFIVKVNADRLSFDAAQMPEWLKSELNKDPETKHSLFEKKKLDSISEGYQTRSPLRPLEQIIKQRSFANFNQYNSNNSNNSSKVLREDSNLIDSQIKFIEQELPIKVYEKIIDKVIDKPTGALDHGTLIKKAKDMGIRPVVFPRIDISR